MKGSIHALFLLILLIPLHIVDKGTPHEDLSSPRCMAAVLVSEAAGASLRGKRLVYEVVRNRADRTPTKSFCDVVLAKHQFTGMTRKKILAVDEKSLTEMWKIATMSDVCSGCLFFHNESVKPSWTRTMKFVVKIDGHSAYKLKEK